MSGKIEEVIEGFLNNALAKIPFLPELKEPSERKLGGGHFTLMAMVSLLPLAIGFLSMLPKVGATISLLTFALVIEAERPPIGRRIDWITRGAGWSVGAILSIITILTF